MKCCTWLSQLTCCFKNLKAIPHNWERSAIWFKLCIDIWSDWSDSGYLRHRLCIIQTCMFSVRIMYKTSCVRFTEKSTCIVMYFNDIINSYQMIVRRSRRMRTKKTFLLTSYFGCRSHLPDRLELFLNFTKNDPGHENCMWVKASQITRTCYDALWSVARRKYAKVCFPTSRNLWSTLATQKQNHDTGNSEL